MKYTKEQLQEARTYAASINRRIAKDCFLPDFGFASHVTEKGKQEYANKNLALADSIEAGELDHNFTVAQRMRYHLTGECVALLP